MTGTTKFFDLIQQTQAKFVDFRFSDLKGIWHHMAFPVSAVDETLLTEGIFFDGSSIAGWCPINESDMVLRPDLTSAHSICVDPYSAQVSLIVICDVYNPTTKQVYNRDPRSIAKKAEQYMQTSGIADLAYFGPEAEFFIFDSVRFDSGSSESFYHIDSDEFPKSNGKISDLNNHGYRPSVKGGYFPVPPLDSLSDMRAEMLTTMEEMGLVVEKHHHEVAPAQHELGIKYNTLVNSADSLQIYKYVVRNTANTYGKTATFMAKPIYGDNGSGMHVHQSLWNNGKPLFAGNEYAGLSETALFYIGGILKHAKALNAFTNPTTNSYKRLIPGFEAPVICAYSAQNRSAACRIPFASHPNGKRVEIRFPDPTANSYLAFSAMLMAGLDGIKNRIHPGESQDHDLFEDHEAAKNLPTVSGSLRESLVALENNHDFLLQGNVFTKDLLNAYSQLKWQEVYALEHRPHPVEYQLYYNT